MSAASKPAAAAAAGASHNLKEELYWVICNRCARQMGKTRIDLSSCGCMVCQDCGPEVLKDGRCRLCKAPKVSAKPIGSSLPPQHLDLFRPLKDQPSLKSIARREKFKTKHIMRGLQLHASLEKFYKKDLKRREEERKKDEENVKNLEKKVEEKMKKLKLMEEEVRQLEKKKADYEKPGDAAVGGARRKRKTHPNTVAGAGSSRSSPRLPTKSPFLTF